MSSLITYRIVEDHADKLKAAARLACNFWNHFVEPETSVVIHIDLFTSPLRYIARSYEPERRGAVTHGRIRFNRAYVKRYSVQQLAGTLAHELGHTLGIGWGRWMELFDTETGHFTGNAIDALPALADMRVETQHGDATRHLHWDEGRHRGELMTGFENKSEHVMPVTIEVMRLLGHGVKRPLEAKTPVTTLLNQLRDQPFTQKEAALQMAAVDFKPTRVWERLFDTLRQTLRESVPRPVPKMPRPRKPRQKAKRA